MLVIVVGTLGTSCRRGAWALVVILTKFDILVLHYGTTKGLSAKDNLFM